MNIPFFNNYQAGIDKELHQSIINRKLVSMKLLLMYRGANVNSKYYNNLLPLHLAIINKSYDILIHLLVLHRADINIRCPRINSTIMHFVCMQNDKIALEILLKYGDKNYLSKDINGKTPLQYCAAYGANDTCTMLLQLPDIDVNVQDNGGNSALHEACQRSNLKIVQLLSSHRDCNLNLTNDDDAPPIHYACMTASGLEIVRLLIEKQAYINMVDRLGRTPINLAYYHLLKDIAILLEAAGVSIEF